MRPICCWMVSCALASAGMSAFADPLGPDAGPLADKPSPDSWRYLIGAGLGVGPTYLGASSTELKFTPYWAIESGRLRLSSGRGNALLAFGRDVGGPGASALLVDRPRFSLSASLRIDSGRSAGDDPALIGLPEVRRTLRLRLAAGYEVAPRWVVGTAISQDVLGRDGGGQFSAWTSVQQHLSPRTQVGVTLGVNGGDARFMRSWFGVPVGSPSGLAAWSPGAGAYQTVLAFDLTRALSPHWLLVGHAQWSRLEGEARRSPVTQRPDAAQASIGLVYRNRP